MALKYPNLFQSLRIGKMVLKNRIIMGPMGGYGFAGLNGEFTERSVDYFVERARGGTGLIVTGVTIADLEVDPYLPGYLAPLYNIKAFISSSAPLMDRVHSYGAKIIIQITMGDGRNGAPTAPSMLPSYWDPAVKCRELSNEEVKKKIQAVINASVVAKKAGFDGVEVHAMHEGYLIDEFATAYTNHRTDEYGGSLINRIRPATEILQGIKHECGSDYPVTIRMGAKSYMKGFNQPSLDGEGEVGRTLEEGIEIAKLLEAAGYDALSIDSGNYDSFYYVHPPMYQKKGFNLALSKEIKKAVRIPVLTAGRIDEPELGERAIADGYTHGVVIARGLLADAEFAIKAQTGQAETIRPCLSCHQGCAERIFAGVGLACAVNPAVMRENSYKIERALATKKVLIIGGGPAGMEAARVSRLRGHEVTLFEAKEKLGGNLIPGGMPSFKEDDRRLIKWYEQELSALGIHIKLGLQVTPALIAEQRADAVIIATGSQPMIPNMSGIDNKNVILCTDVLNKEKTIGPKIVIAGGGLVGCETALDMAMKGKDVTIVEALPNVLMAGKPVPLMNAMMLTDLLKKHHVKIKTSHRLSAVNDEGAIVSGANGEEMIKADTIIIAIGFRTQKDLFQQITATGMKAYEIGDGREVANIMNAIWDAYEIARSI